MTSATVHHLDSTSTVAAFDLDQTLIYSRTSAGDPATLPLCVVVEAPNGMPQSRMTVTAWNDLAVLMNIAEVVPVTTRTPEHYAQVNLPQMPTYALCANGGVLLVDGLRDADWDVWAKETVARSAPLDVVLTLMREIDDQHWVLEAHPAENLFCYLIATTRADIPADWLSVFTAACTHMGWTVSVQGRKVYAVPSGLTKAIALMRLRDLIAERDHKPVRVYAAGDSLLDASMLEAADEAIRPAHGELHDQGWHAAGVQVTTATGARAGAQIVEWMLGRAQQG